MWSKFKGFSNWCNQHQGILAFIAILVPIASAIPYSKINLGFATPILDQVSVLLGYRLEIPVYSLIFLALIGWIYSLRLKHKYAKKKIDINFLDGRWKNEWTVDDITHSEDCEIKSGGQYFLMGKIWFHLINFSYDYQANEITFLKSAAQKGDNRTALNVLKVINNDLLVGREENHKIRYTRILH